MQAPEQRPEAIPNVCDIELVGDLPKGKAPDLLIEVPHGATLGRHFQHLRQRLTGPFPDDLEAFFFVNTDVGAPECARDIALRVNHPSGCEQMRQALERSGATDTTRPLTALIVRSLIPRTFVDCNRVLDHSLGDFAKAGFTPGLPEYITNADDKRLLGALHRSYTEQAERAFRWVCGSGGRALTLHTYAPRFVEITKIDANIVNALRDAYSPANYDRWKPRPDVDVISESKTGELMTSAELVTAVRAQYAAADIPATENATYRLHPSTMGYVHAERYPERVLGLEISRTRLADPFTPFQEMQISETKSIQMAIPIAAAYLETQSD